MSAPERNQQQIERGFLAVFINDTIASHPLKSTNFSICCWFRSGADNSGSGADNNGYSSARERTNSKFTIRGQAAEMYDQCGVYSRWVLGSPSRA